MNKDWYLEKQTVTTVTVTTSAGIIPLKCSISTRYEVGKHAI